MDSSILRRQCSDDQLRAMIAGGCGMVASGEKEICRLERWRRCELSRILRSDPSDELDTLRRSVDGSRELVEAAERALAL